MASEHVDKSRKTDQPPFKVYKLPLTASHKIFRDSLPVSCAACHQAVEAMKHNARNYTYQQWYMWYVQEELGTELDQELKSKAMPSDNIIQDVAKFSGECPYAPENFVVKCCAPSMAYNPYHVATTHLLLSLRHQSSGQTQLVRIFHHMQSLVQKTSLLQDFCRTRQARFGTSSLDISRPSSLLSTVATLMTSQMSKSQRFGVISSIHLSSSHGLASIRDKEISADGWACCVDNVSMPPELLKTLTTHCSSLKTRFQMETPPVWRS